IAQGDLFRVDLPAAQPFVASNLSMTSGILTPPFDYGYLEHDGIRRAPESTGYVVYDEYGQQMLWVDPATGVVPFLGGVTSLDSLDVAGDFLVGSITRPAGLVDPLQRELALVQIPKGGIGAMLASLPQGSRLTRQAGSRSHDVFCAV